MITFNQQALEHLIDARECIEDLHFALKKGKAAKAARDKAEEMKERQKNKKDYWDID